jgi:hypothetical protein
VLLRQRLLREVYQEQRAKTPLYVVVPAKRSFIASLVRYSCVNPSPFLGFSPCCICLKLMTCLRFHFSSLFKWWLLLGQHPTSWNYVAVVCYYAECSNPSTSGSEGSLTLVTFSTVSWYFPVTRYSGLP